MRKWMIAGTLVVVGGLFTPHASRLTAQDRRTAPARQPAALTFWEQVGDSTLVRLTAEALRANRDVQMAESRVQQARAARSRTRLDLVPTVTFAAGYTRQRFSQADFVGAGGSERSVYDGGLVAAWELDVFGRLRKNLRGADALSQSAQEDVRDVERIIAAEVATAYFDLRGAQDQLDVARRNAENQRRTLQLTKNRLDAGRGTAFDTERAQAQLSTTLASVPVFEARVAAARNRIGVLVGRDPRLVADELAAAPCPAEPEVPCSTPELPAEFVAADPELAVRSRPDVRSAERRLAAETAFVGAARADYLPRVSLAGTAGYSSLDFDGLGNSGTGRYAVGPVITWPLLNLGRVKANVDAAKGLEAEARARYEQTILLAREEIETARVGYVKARERLAQLEAAAAASDRAAQLARLRFEGGVADFLQVLDAERSLLAAQDQLAQGRNEAVNALVAVYRASGQ
jgi:NodT family efflux transporter outer membrane factor (OMF) lipoprotein